MNLRLGPKTFRANSTSQWSRNVTLPDGREFTVSIERGRAKRIAFKRRGENIGHEWYGNVYVHATREQLRERVAKSAGASTILNACGIFADYSEATAALTVIDLMSEQAARMGSGRWAATLRKRKADIVRLNGLVETPL